MNLHFEVWQNCTQLSCLLAGALYTHYTSMERKREMHFAVSSNAVSSNAAASSYAVVSHPMPLCLLDAVSFDAVSFDAVSFGAVFMSLEPSYLIIYTIILAYAQRTIYAPVLMTYDYDESKYDRFFGYVARSELHYCITFPCATFSPEHFSFDKQLQRGRHQRRQHQRRQH